MHQPTSLDTIYARATPPGKSGVAVVRLSGAQALAALRQITRREDFPARMAHYTPLYDPATGEVLDQALVLYFPAPHSFTGEDVVELHTHGSRAVMVAVLQVLSRMPGLRPAEAGEFARRAFQNGKMDLTRVEGLADLIDAETRLQATQALRQMSGGLSQRYDQWRQELITIMALLEAYIDFPDEDIPADVTAEARAIAVRLHGEITEHLTNPRGERLREGAVAAIIGAPNVGKSSLLNLLANRDVAIVSDIAGTTRDALEVHLDIGGYPLTLVDTAGLREAADVIESEGIARSRRHAREADFTVAMFDVTAEKPDSETAALITPESVVIINKVDEKTPDDDFVIQDISPIRISTKTSAGVTDLLTSLEEKLASLMQPGMDAAFTRARHRTALEQAVTALVTFQQALAEHRPWELAVEDLRAAALALGRITGHIDVEDVLDALFSRFCIGK